MKNKKLLGLLLSVLVATSTIVISHAESQISRVFSNDRYTTSLETAKKINTDVAVLASGSDFPDALSAYNIVKSKNAKLILVNNDDKQIGFKLKEQGVRIVYIVGGINVISNNVEKDLSSEFRVIRISGLNRYATNKKTLEVAKFKSVGVADGNNFPDALSSMGLLKNQDMGLMLVDGEKQYNTDLNVKYTFGGSVKQDGGKRLSGSDRYKTALAIASNVDSITKILLVDGRNFPDALSAINLSNDNTVILPINNNVSQEMVDLCKKVENIIVIGGTNSVSNESLDKIMGKMPIIDNREIAWKGLYKELLNNSYAGDEEYDVMVSVYFLHDIDKNGIPELIVKRGPVETEASNYFYTVENGHVKFLAKYYAFNTWMHKNIETDELISYYFDRLEFEVLSKYTMINGQIDKKVIRERLIGENEKLKQPPFNLEYSKTNDFKLIDNYTESNKQKIFVKSNKQKILDEMKNILLKNKVFYGETGDRDKRVKILNEIKKDSESYKTKYFNPMDLTQISNLSIEDFEKIINVNRNLAGNLFDVEHSEEPINALAILSRMKMSGYDYSSEEDYYGKFNDSYSLFKMVMTKEGNSIYNMNYMFSKMNWCHRLISEERSIEMYDFEGDFDN